MIHYARQRCVLVVHSHGVDDYIDLSPALVAYETEKAIKEVGRGSFLCKPVRNYLNLVRPGDLVSFYIDAGEGRGWEWDFFGFVDEIGEESRVTNEHTGATQTGYPLLCSDFQKALRSHTYTNPALKGRTDLVLAPEMAMDNTGGFAMMQAGVIAFGSPADVLESILGNLLGWGTQFRTPESYPPVRVQQDRRDFIRARAVGRLPTSVRRLLPFSDLTDALQEPDFGRRIVDLLRAFKKRVDDASTVGGREQALEAYWSANASAFRLRMMDNLLRRTDAFAPRGILDLIDLRFIEYNAIDGFLLGSGVTPRVGSVQQMLAEYTNEPVNELFFDLRPVANGGTSENPDPMRGESYSYEADPLGINLNGFQGMPPHAKAVQYTPACVFREYPFSTVQGLDLRGHRILGGKADAGFIPFGPIFSKRLDGASSGRVLYDYEEELELRVKPPIQFESLSHFALPDPLGANPVKHLDVVSLHTSECLSWNLKRNDAEVANMIVGFDLRGGAVDTAFQVLDLLPVANALSIQRHGLRLYELRSRYGTFPSQSLTKSGGRDQSATVRSFARWCTMFDHWHQHAPEYLKGAIELARTRTDIRVGMRLDWQERKESYYTEKVSKRGVLNDSGGWDPSQSLGVARGQRNDPYPLYVPPSFPRDPGIASVPVPSVIFLRGAALARAGGGDRIDDESRLGHYMPTVDSPAVDNPTPEGSGRNTVDGPERDWPGVVIYPDGDA